MKKYKTPTDNEIRTRIELLPDSEYVGLNNLAKWQRMSRKTFVTYVDQLGLPYITSSSGKSKLYKKGHVKNLRDQVANKLSKA